MLNDLKNLYRYRELLWIWTLRNIRVRYKQSVLGGFWAILQPLSLMVIFSVIFSFFVRVPTDNLPYPVFSYSALLPWTFFSASLTLGIPSLVNNINLVTKVYFPREILPMAALFSSFFDFLVASLVFLGMLIFYRIPLHPTALLLPVLLLIQAIFTLGLVLIASALNVFFRDVLYLLPLGIQLWMYATPVIYPLSVVPQWLRGVYMLNPMTVLIEGYRDVVLKGQWPDPLLLAGAAAVSLIIFLMGYSIFKRVEWQFADLI